MIPKAYYKVVFSDLINVLRVKTRMQISRVLENYRTEILGLLVGLILIISGLLLPNYMPDTIPGPPGFRDAEWLKQLLSLL